MATTLIPRAQAGLRPPRSRTALAAAEGLTAHWWGPSPWPKSADRSTPARFAATTDHARCAAIWRGGQAFHMSPGWGGTVSGGADVAYNSAVCPHGVRFEGRGPGIRSGAQGTNAGNSRSLATCYLAGEGDPLTDAAKAAFLDEARRLSGRATPRWQHGDWKSTACAGPPIRGWKAQGWPAPGGTTPAPAPAPAPPSTPGAMPTIRRGSRGAAVLAAQRMLNRAGSAGLTTDGVFGAATETAVRAFQRFFRLGVDGVIGPATWPILTYIDALKAAEQAAKPGARPTIRRGDRGPAVSALQAALNRVGSAGLAVDGIYGAATEAQVRNFQTFFRLGVDGIAGPKTWNLLDYLDGRR